MMRDGFRRFGWATWRDRLKEVMKAEEEGRLEDFLEERAERYWGFRTAEQRRQAVELDEAIRMLRRRALEGALRGGYEEAMGGMFMIGRSLKNHVARRYGWDLEATRGLQAAMADLRAGFRGGGGG